MRTVVLFQADHIALGVIPLKGPHIGDICTTERINRLVIIAHGKDNGLWPTQ